MSYWLIKKMSKIVTLASLFVMVVAVVPGLNYDGYFYFQIPDVAGNFESAKSGCNSSALAVVRDSATQMALTEFLNRSKTNSLLYINLKLRRNAGDTWFLLNGSQYSGEIGYQENKSPEYKLYGHLNPNDKAEFLVQASNPNHLRKFICDFGGSTCPNNSTNNFTFKERCYVKYEDENLTWYKARESCFNKGGDLAKFQNESNPWIPPFNTSWLNTSLTYWVGIRYSDWSWKSSVDDKEVINTFWSNGKPNNNNYECVCVDPNGSPAWSWTDCDCTVERPFVCLKIVPTTTVTTTTPTTTTMTSATTKTPLTTAATSIAPAVSTNNGHAPSSGSSQNNLSRTIGLGAGIGGGLLLILIVVIIVLVVVIARRKSKRKSGSESRLEVENEGDTQHAQVVKSDGKDVYSVANEPKWNPASNGVYASVVPNGKLNADLTEPPTEIIYTAPDFIQDEKPMPFDSNYTEATPVRDDLHTLRRNTDSIYPQSCHDLYENLKQSS